MATRKITPEIFRNRCSAIFNDKYEYPLLESELITTDSKITAVCPVHGGFSISATNHIHGGWGCKKCRNPRKKYLPPPDEILTLLHEKFKGNITFPKFYEEYSGARCTLTGVCKIHGESKAVLKDLLNAVYGCSKCSYIERGKNSTTPLEEYISRMSLLYKNKYTYTLSGPYIGAHTRITAVCPTHGPWEVLIYNHLYNDCECPKCSGIISKGSVDLFNYIKPICDDAVSEHWIGDFRVDIYIPSKKIAIEYNGLYYHSSKFRPRDSHIQRREYLESVGVRQIIIWEDEWPSEKTKLYLRTQLGKNSPINARECRAEVVPLKEGEKFIGSIHLMGSGLPCPLYLGLYHPEKGLVACVGFRKVFNRYELYRAAYLPGHSVRGGLSKIISYWVKNYCEGPDLVSYIDLDKFDGRSYFNSGFKYVSTDLSLFYCKRNLRIPRQSVMKSKLKKYPGYSPELSEKEILEISGMYQCWNSGTAKVVLEVL